VAVSSARNNISERSLIVADERFLPYPYITMFPPFRLPGQGAFYIEIPRKLLNKSQKKGIISTNFGTLLILKFFI
jgi:hypothetical protein